MGEVARVRAKKVWASYTSEEKENRMRNNSFFNWNLLNSSQRSKRIETAIRSLEQGKERMNDYDKELRNKKAGVAISTQIRSLSSEQQEKRLRNSFFSEEVKRKHPRFMKKVWASYTSEERQKRLLNSLHSAKSREKARETLSSPEVRKRIAESMKKYWNSLTYDEQSALIMKTILASRSPNKVELALWDFLEANFSGQWLYNGDKRQGVVIGRKVPDFVHSNGVKAIIEVFGEYWHKKSEVEETIAHYNKYGFRCLVVWEKECYNLSHLVTLVTELTS